MKELREEVLFSRFSNTWCEVTDRVGGIAISEVDLLFIVEKFAIKPEKSTTIQLIKRSLDLSSL